MKRSTLIICLNLLISILAIAQDSDASLKTQIRRNFIYRAKGVYYKSYQMLFPEINNEADSLKLKEALAKGIRTVAERFDKQDNPENFKKSVEETFRQDLRKDFDKRNSSNRDSLINRMSFQELMSDTLVIMETYNYITSGSAHLGYYVGYYTSHTDQIHNLKLSMGGFVPNNIDEDNNRLMVQSIKNSSLDVFLIKKPYYESKLLDIRAIPAAITTVYKIDDKLIFSHYAFLRFYTTMPRDIYTRKERNIKLIKKNMNGKYWESLGIE